MSDTATPAAADAVIPAWLTLLLAAACGLIAANLYYAQPLAGPIAASIGMSAQAAGLVVTLTQIGYGLGLLLIVPLGDLLENRRLVLCGLGLTALALLAAAFASTPAQFLAAAFTIGLGAVVAQVLVPYAAHLAPLAVRGRVVGQVMSGLLFGIMLARPVSSLIANRWGWHTVFTGSAVAIALLALLLGRTLPARQPQTQHSYGALLRSLGALLLHERLLQRRACYQFFLFAAFSLFWTVAPLYLASPVFGLTQWGIAWFGLAGVAGAIAAPLAGRLADRGVGRGASALAMLAGALAFLLPLAATPGGTAALALLTATAVLLDAGVSASLIFGQRALFASRPELRARLNGLFISIFFCGGALGSALGAWVYAHYGWSGAQALGCALPLCALVCLASERAPAQLS